MPRIPIPTAGNSMVAGPRQARVGPPVTLAEGVNAAGRVVEGVGRQLQASQEARDRQAEQLAADQFVADQAQAKAQREQAMADAKLAAGNAAVRYKLDTDAVLRQRSEELSAGQIKPEEYEGKVAADLRKVGQRLANSVPEMGRQAFDAGIQQAGAANVLKIRDTLDKHAKDRRMGALVQGAADLERLAISDLPQAKAAASGLFGPDGPYAAIEGREAAAKAHQAWRESATRAHYQRQIADAQDDMAALAGIREEVGKAADLDPMQQSAMLSSIDSRRAVLESRATAQAERADRRAQAALTGLRTLSEGGFPVSPDYASEVVTATAGTPYAAEVGEILKGAAQTAGFASKPVAEQDRIVAEMTAQAAAGGVDPESSKRLDRMQKIRDASRRDYAANPWQASADRGQIEAVPPLDSSSILGMVQSLQSRLDVIDAVELAAGGPVSPLQPDEAAGFGQMLDSLPVTDRAEMLGRVRQVVGPQRMRALAGQLAKDDPTLAVVAAAEADGLKAANGESVGALILRGQEAIEQKRVQMQDWMGKDRRNQMIDFLADAIVSPVARDAAIDAGMKVWAARQVDGGDITIEEAIETVTGPVVEWGGGKVLAPQGWTDDEFRVAVKDLSALRITQMTGGADLFVAGAPITPAQLAEQMGSVQLRQGTGNRYGFQIGTAMVTDRSGRPVMLELQRPEKVGGFLDWARGR